MKAFDFFYNFIVLCALLGAGIWMLTDGNFVFGTLVSGVAVYHGYNFIRTMSK